MNILNNHHQLGIGWRIKNKRNLTKTAVSLFLISIFIFSFILTTNQYNTINDKINYNEQKNPKIFDPNLPKSSSNPLGQQDPFTINFTKIKSCFDSFNFRNIISKIANVV